MLSVSEKRFYLIEIGIEYKKASSTFPFANASIAYEVRASKCEWKNTCLKSRLDSIWKNKNIEMDCRTK